MKLKKIKKKDFIFALLFALVYLGSLFFFFKYDYRIVRILFYYLGFLNFSIWSLMLYVFCYSILKIFKKTFLLTKKIVLLFFIFLPIIFSCIAIYNFHKGITIEQHYIESSKVSRPYRFLQVSDIQYGTVSRNYLDDVIEKIKQQDIDFVVFTGDLVDFDHYKQEDLEILNTLDVPVYFERGNHEFYHFPQKILSYLEEIGSVDVLLNEKVSFDELDIVGIDYQEGADRYQELIQAIELDDNRFSILLYHEPKHVEYSAALGFDLLLYGHTHGGQIWPFTEVVDIIYTYADGYYTINESVIYTSDGAALWGPRMRLGSQNEMVIFNINPQK